MWSLGVTFFEILIGRTPFEVVDGEEFCTEEDMEKYWARTVRFSTRMLVACVLTAFFSLKESGLANGA